MGDLQYASILEFSFWIFPSMVYTFMEIMFLLSVYFVLNGGEMQSFTHFSGSDFAR